MGGAKRAGRRTGAVLAAHAQTDNTAFFGPGTCAAPAQCKRNSRVLSPLIISAVCDRLCFVSNAVTRSAADHNTLGNIGLAALWWQQCLPEFRRRQKSFNTSLGPEMFLPDASSKALSSCYLDNHPPQRLNCMLFDCMVAGAVSS